VGRLIVISNRVTVADSRAESTGGLAVGILAALRESNGIWCGWSGELSETPDDEFRRFSAGQIDYAVLELQSDDYQGYYNGFSNSVLWPLFHYRLDLMNFSREAYDAYRRVNTKFARAMAALLRPDDIIWVHDYHLIPLAEELRALGVMQPIGFFLHTPFPPHRLMSSLPCHDEIMRSFTAYDVVGFQTRGDRDSFRDYMRCMLDGECLGDDLLQVGNRVFLTGAFPIGIDVDSVASFAANSSRSQRITRLRTSLQGRDLIVGVDRLDYSKGLPERFRAFERLLEEFPVWRKRVTLLQIAPPTREEVADYSTIRHVLEMAAGHINGVFAEYDWMPVRYLNRSFSRQALTGFLRYAKVGLVTPLRDGMNLVAKEYIAAQDPDDPGVLVLSRFAGAAEEIDSAMLVNPYDVDEVAEALNTALKMPLAERQARWHESMNAIARQDISAWRNRFVAALRAAPYAA
jgi:trehalose 6-phosphate synthase